MTAAEREEEIQKDTRGDGQFLQISLRISLWLFDSDNRTGRIDDHILGIFPEKQFSKL